MIWKTNVINKNVTHLITNHRMRGHYHVHSINEIEQERQKLMKQEFTYRPDTLVTRHASLCPFNIDKHLVRLEVAVVGHWLDICSNCTIPPERHFYWNFTLLRLRIVMFDMTMMLSAAMLWQGLAPWSRLMTSVESSLGSSKVRRASTTYFIFSPPWIMEWNLWLEKLVYWAWFAWKWVLMATHS
jgi:hypothetical protein